MAGAVVIGASYRALGVVRSLGRHQVPVWVVRRDDQSIAGCSRYTRRVLDLRRTDEQSFIDRLVELGSGDLEGAALFPSDDEDAAVLARHHEQLGAHFRLGIPPWDVLRVAYDKRATQRLAAELGVPQPCTWFLAEVSDDALSAVPFPAVVKPAFAPRSLPASTPKAWPVRDPQELVEAIAHATSLLPREILMIQEMIPGDGAAQLSYAALCRDGRPVASLAAQRIRQRPMDFGRASTYVETIDEAEVAEPAERLLGALGFSGLAEVEFKRDSRDGIPKLLEINPRVWGWHSVGRRAGVDFPYLQWRMLHGEALRRERGRPGVRWIRAITDVPTVAEEMLAGRLSPARYISTLQPPLEFAILARDDLRPALLNAPTLALVAARRRARGGAPAESVVLSYANVHNR